MDYTATRNARKVFLFKWKRNIVFPQHITNVSKKFFSIPYKSTLVKNVMHNYLNLTKWKLLNYDIKDLHIHLQFLYKNLNNLKYCIQKRNIDNEIVNNFYKSDETKSLKLFNNKQRILDNKFNLLLMRNNKSGDYSNDNKWLKNLSDIQIPKDVADIVSLGHKFNLNQDLNKQDVITTTLCKFLRVIQNIPT